MLSEKTIAELKTILAEEFDIECTTGGATEIGDSLVQYVETLLEINQSKNGNTDHNR